MISLRRTVVRGAAVTFGAVLAQNLISLVVLAILARLLSPSDFGLTAAASVVIGVGQMVTQLGLGPALVQRRVLTIEHRKIAFTFSLFVGMIAGLTVFLAADLIAETFRMPELAGVLRALSVLFPVSSVSTVATSLLQRDMQFNRMGAIQTLSHFAGFGLLGVVLAIKGAGVWALVAAQLGSALVRMLVTLTLERASIGLSFRATEFRELFSFSGGYSIVQVLNYLANQADYFVVGRLGTPAALGIYSRAYQLMMVPANLSGAVANTVLFPALSAIQLETDKLGRGLRLSLSTLTILCVPASLWSVLFAPEIISVAMGDRWSGAVLPFQLFASVMSLRAASKITDAFARALGAVYRQALNQAVYLICVTLGALVGMGWGVGGVAAGVSVAIVINYVLAIALCNALAGPIYGYVIGLYARQLAAVAVIGPAALATKGLLEALGSGSLLAAAGGGIFITVVYSVILLLWPALFGSEATQVSSWLSSSLRKALRNWPER